MQLEPGMLARSKAGHDKNCIYVIICVKDEYVYLADGKTRTVCRPKKKKQKHIQIIKEKQDITGVDDAKLRKIIRNYRETAKTI